MEKIRKYWNRPSRSAYVFIAPSIILLILFNIIPLIMAFGLSFFDVPITMNHATFVGWDNFVEAFHDPRFINSLKVTAIFTGIEVPVQVLGALVIAAFISKNNKRNKFTCSVLSPCYLFCNCNRYYVENDFTFKYRLYNGCFTVNGIRKN